MNTLSQNQIDWNAYCGFPSKYRVMQVVMNYAEGSSSLSEYTEFYISMTPDQKQMADDLLMDIYVNVIVDSNGKAK